MDNETPLANSSSTVTTSEGGGSKGRDEALTKVNQDKAYSHIRAWEENQKAKAFNKFQRLLSKINAWENTKKATAESKLRKAEEKLEKRRATHVEKMKNRVAAAHRQAEEMRAGAEARKGEDTLQVEEMAAAYRASGHLPKRFLCFEA